MGEGGTGWQRWYSGESRGLYVEGCWGKEGTLCCYVETGHTLLGASEAAAFSQADVLTSGI